MSEAVETPVVETPIVETPVVETPVIETPVVELPAFRVPGEGATAEEWTAWRAAIGAPETPEGYEIGDDDNAKALAALLHKHNIPTAAAKELTAVEAARAAKEAEETKAYTDGQVALLKAEWGDKLGENTQKADAAAKALGVNLDEVGDAALIKVFAKLHTWMAQDTRMQSAMGANGEFLSMIREDTRTKALDIMKNPSNPLHTRYRNGDPEVNKQVLALLASN
jgi:hypothetical protein